MPYTPPAYDEEAGGEFEPLPVGNYVSSVEALELRYGQESGEPYVAWTFVIAEGDNVNRKLWNNTSWSPKAINMPTGWYATIAACGETPTEYEGEWETEEDLVEAVAEACTGKLVEVAVGHRRYEGKIYNDVVAIRPSDSSGIGEEPAARRGRRPAPAAEPAAAAPKRSGRKSDTDF